MNLVQPAMQLAGKIPDVHVQLWASSLLKGKQMLMFFFWFGFTILLKNVKCHKTLYVESCERNI